LRIGLYGGIFDPIHNAHLLIAQFIKEDLKLDKIIFIPSGIPPHKDVFWPTEKRLSTVRLAVADNPWFEISTIEIENAAVSYSVDTIHKLNAEIGLPKGDLIWIVGSDNFVDFDKWKNPSRIFEMCTVVVFPRKAGDYARAPEEFSRKAVYLKHAPIIEISSTQVRARIEKGLSVKYFVPQVIEDLVASGNAS
jgi:nicotinate-nucleotide adenylyltransferase